MQILRSKDFANQVKKLSRKHRLILDDISDLIDALERGERPGYRLGDLDDLPVHWVRIPNRSARSGKSGGFRVVYYFDDEVVLLIMIDLRANVGYVPPDWIMGVLRNNGLI